MRRKLNAQVPVTRQMEIGVMSLFLGDGGDGVDQPDGCGKIFHLILAADRFPAPGRLPSGQFFQAGGDFGSGKKLFLSMAWGASVGKLFHSFHFRIARLEV